MHRPPQPLSLSQRLGDWALGLWILGLSAAIAAQITSAIVSHG